MLGKATVPLATKTRPVAEINPAVSKLPPVTLAVAEINPAVRKLPPVILPVTLKLAPVLTLPVPFGVNTMLELAADVCISS